ncbi:glycosyltransferase [Frigoribacterium sp. Leaf164]|nr:glycosyltransferase [Frigoribacterium sp. Leaf164]
MVTARPPWGRGLPGNRWDLLDGDLPAEPPRVSVVVPHYRQQAELDRTLAALARQTHPADRLEVVVVDDGSPEAPVVPPGVVLVRQRDEGFRLAAARNLGVRTATGDVLVFLDADTAPEPGYVAAVTRLPALAPEVVAVGRRRHADFGGVPVDAPVEVAGPAAELPSPAWLDDAHRASRDLLDADDRSYRHVIGAVTACSRWLVEEVGGWDEGFTEYGGEDWEWVHRAWRGGAVLAHVRDAVAWHDGPDWAGRSGDDEARQRRQNAETITLSRLVAVSGSRPRALRGGDGPVDVVVRLGRALSPGRAFLTADSVLAALPEARVVVPSEVASAVGGDPRVVSAAAVAERPEIVTGARVTVDLPGEVRVRDGVALVRAVAEVGVGELGTVELCAVEPEDGGREGGRADEAGGAAPVVVARVTSRRAELRRARWERDDLFRTERRAADGLEPLVGEPSLAAWLGGWG